MRRGTLEIKLHGVGGHSSTGKVFGPEFRIPALKKKAGHSGTMPVILALGRWRQEDSWSSLASSGFNARLSKKERKGVVEEATHIGPHLHTLTLTCKHTAHTK